MSSLFTFSDLRSQVLQNLDEAGAATTDSTYILAGNFINQALLARLTQEPWPFMRWEPAETFQCNTSTRFYTLHQEFWRPDYFFNRTTNAYLIETPGRQISGSYARWNTDTGRVLRFRFGGRDCVSAQPVASSVISIVSSSASDTGASKAVTIRGVTTDGVTSETITPTGLSPALSVNNFTKILAVTKGDTWVGTLTVSSIRISDSTVTTNLVLFPDEFGRSYQVLETLTLPSGNDTIEYSFFRQPTKLSGENDIPDIPPPHVQILVWDACILFSGYITDLNAASVKMWVAMEESMEKAMKQAFFEGISLEAEPRYVRFMSSEEGSAPFIRST